MRADYLRGCRAISLVIVLSSIVAGQSTDSLSRTDFRKSGYPPKVIKEVSIEIAATLSRTEQVAFQFNAVPEHLDFIVLEISYFRGWYKNEYRNRLDGISIGLGLRAEFENTVIFTASGGFAKKHVDVHLLESIEIDNLGYIITPRTFAYTYSAGNYFVNSHVMVNSHDGGVYYKLGGRLQFDSIRVETEQFVFGANFAVGYAF